MVTASLRLSFEWDLHTVDKYMLEPDTFQLSLEIHFCQKKYVPHQYDDKDYNSCKILLSPLFKPEDSIMGLKLPLLLFVSLLIFLKPHLLFLKDMFLKLLLDCFRRIS